MSELLQAQLLQDININHMPKLFREEIEAALKAQVMPSFTSTFEVAVAELSGDASVIGAAAWAQHVLRTRAAEEIGDAQPPA